MRHSRRENFKPWARNLPTFVLRSLLVALSPVFFVLSAWEGGVKEGLQEFLEEWRAAGDVKPSEGKPE